MDELVSGPGDPTAAMHRRPLAFLATIAALLGGVSISAAVHAAPGATVTTPHVQAELIAHAPDGIAPGAALQLALQITHQPGWHTYWKNPGDSGLPTTLDWTLPAGLSAGDIAWPVPKKIPIGRLANYGYEDTVMLPVTVAVAPTYRSFGSVEVKLSANWLVCKLECIPESGEFTLRLPALGSTALHAAAFAAHATAQPATLNGTATARVDGNALAISVQGLPAAWQGRDLALFPETPEITETAATPRQRWDGATWYATVPLAAQRSATPAALPLLLAHGDAAVRADAPVSGSWPPGAAAPQPVSPALAAALAANALASASPAAPVTTAANASVTTLGLAAALLGALLGGLLLNLMPCVLPVLAIKFVGFSQAGLQPAARRAQGMAYTAGVVGTFVALGGLMLALRAAGAQLGWGFQLQSPGTVAALAALFTLVGLNLAGVFNVGSWLPGSVAGSQLRNPVANHFWSGVLAVAIASPCTAPFMGASLGLALVLPAPVALAVFAALGLGMALPFLAAALLPGAPRWLPQPGAWMETFRRAMAFPVFATVAWLVWVVGQQSGIDGAGALLALLVALAAVVWALAQRGRARMVFATISIAACAILAGTIGSNVIKLQPDSAAEAAAPGGWQPWSADRVAALQAEGRTVFIDFTAAWCITCQVNKQTTLASDELRADFAARNVALLRADWTRRDPAITAALAALGRNGVPVYVVLAPGRAPVVLSELLSVSEVQGALAGS